MGAAAQLRRLLFAPTATYLYAYGDGNWKDKLTSYNGNAITYDAIGNPLSYYNGFTFDWQNGRQLAGVTGNSQTISYTYNADGIRTSKTVNGVTTNYTLEGSNVVMETNGTDTIWYYYDASGSLTGFELNGTAYFYVKNLQGDIIAITDASGTKVVEYLYDSWGKLISTTGSLASTVGVKNPYRYRGYRYDTETGLYYLQSRYYDPVAKRFVNADGYASTGQGVLGHNMFAYCGNNPIKRIDCNGQTYEDIAETLLEAAKRALIAAILEQELSEELKHFVATIAGEAIGENEKTQKAVAHTIMNRFHEPRDVWNNVTSVSDVLVHSQYNAVGSNQYNQCMAYLENRDGSNRDYEDLIFAVIPIYYGFEIDFTNGAHYIFNIYGSVALLNALESQPDRYEKCGPFEDISDTEYRMYRCLW